MTNDLKITAPTTPSLHGFTKFKERQAMGSPTSPGMSIIPSIRKERNDEYHTNSYEDSEENSDTDSLQKANTGRWTDAEHKLFLKGLECFPYRAWKKIATLIKTRSVVQIRTHAQKYYQKLAKEEAKGKERTENHFLPSSNGYNSIHPPTTRQKGMKKQKFSFDESHYTKIPKCKQDTKPIDRIQHGRNEMEGNKPIDLKCERMESFDVPMLIENPDYDESLSHLTPVNDQDMLELTDEDWFSSTSENERDIKFDDEIYFMEDISPVTSPKKKNDLFSNCDNSFDFQNGNDPYSILFDEPNGITSEEFILDPQTFLTCYFNKDV